MDFNSMTNDHSPFLLPPGLDANYPTNPCVFPFIFENNLYSSCTTDGRSDGRLWCSISSNFDIEPMWVYCEPSGKQNR